MPLKFGMTVDDKANPAMERLNKNVKKVRKSTSKAGELFKAVFGAQVLLGSLRMAGRAVGNFVSQIDKIGKAGDQFDKMSKRVGISVEFLSSFGHAAELAGTSITALEPAFRRLATNVRDATDGLKSSTDAFDDLGIQVLDAKGNMKDLDDIIVDVADSFQSITSETEKLAIAQRLFGRGGAAMIPILNQGRDAIREQMEEAKRLGIVWSTEAAAQAAQYVDAMTKLRFALDGASRTAFLPFLVAVTPKLERMAVIVGEQLVPKFLRFFSIGKEAEITNEIDNLTVGLNNLRNELEKRQKGGFFSFLARSEKDLNQMIKEREDRIAGLRGQLKALKAETPTIELPKLEPTGPGTDIAPLVSAPPMEMVEEGIATMKTTQLDFQKWQVDNMQEGFARQRAELDVWYKENEALFRKNQWNMTKLHKEFSDRRKEIRRAEQIAEAEMISGSLSGFQDLFSQLGERNRSFAVMSKTLAIAQATIDTWVGANKALASGPPPFNFIAAAGVVAAGLANVSKIQSQQFEFGTKSAGGGSATVGERGPERVFLPPGTEVMTHAETKQRVEEEATRGGAMSQVTVVIQGNVVQNDEWIRDSLIPSLQMEMTRA